MKSIFKWLFALLFVVVIAFGLVIKYIIIPYNSWWLGVVGNFFGIESGFVRWLVVTIIDIFVTAIPVMIIISILKNGIKNGK